jgi:hypothetical protein
MPTYHEMEMRYGSAAAEQILREIEKAAFLPSKDLATLDPETRLALACRVQDEMTPVYLRVAA